MHRLRSFSVHASFAEQNQHRPWIEIGSRSVRGLIDPRSEVDLGRVRTGLGRVQVVPGQKTRHRISIKWPSGSSESKDIVRSTRTASNCVIDQRRFADARQPVESEASSVADSRFDNLTYYLNVVVTDPRGPFCSTPPRSYSALSMKSGAHILSRLSLL